MLYPRKKPSFKWAICHYFSTTYNVSIYELNLPPEHLDQRMVCSVASLILGIPAPVFHIDAAHSTEDKFKVAATKGSEVVKRDNVSKTLRRKENITFCPRRLAQFIQ